MCQDKLRTRTFLFIVDPAVAPTCTAEGLTEGSHCSICREVLVPQQAIPATGHHYDATVTDPTCTAGGFTVYKCSACGDTYTADETAARGHTEVIHAAIAPKCTKDGLTAGCPFGCHHDLSHLGK